MTYITHTWQTGGSRYFIASTAARARDAQDMVRDCGTIDAASGFIDYIIDRNGTKLTAIKYPDGEIDWPKIRKLCGV